MTDAEAKPRKKARIAPTATAMPINSNEAIMFHFLEDVSMVTQSAELDPLKGYPPSMTHQTFDDEEILGYVGLHVDIFVSTDKFVPRMQHKFDQKLPPSTDFVAALSKHFPLGLPQSVDEAEAAAAAAPPLVDALAGCESVLETEAYDGSKVSVLHANLVSASPELKALHNRMQPFLLFYVDAAELLAHDDPRWELLLAVKRDAAGAATNVLGFLTFYRYYAFPHHQRTRVAQVLVLPPYQRKGVGRCLLQAVNEMVLRNDSCKDVTFEDAADELQSLRQRMDAERVIAGVPDAWAAARAAIAAAVTAVRAPGARPEGADGAASLEASRSVASALSPPPAALAAMVRALKIVPAQAAAVWEVLLWAAGVRGGAPGAAGAAAQDDVADALQGFLVHKELSNIKATGAGADVGDQIPPNKVVVDGDGGEEDDGRFVVYRTDLPRRGDERAEPTASVNEETMEAVMELVNERTEELERIVHGMRWPDAATK